MVAVRPRFVVAFALLALCVQPAGAQFGGWKPPSFKPPKIPTPKPPKIDIPLPKPPKIDFPLPKPPKIPLPKPPKLPSGKDILDDAKDLGGKISDDFKKLGGKVSAETKKKIGQGVEWLKKTPLWKWITDVSLGLFMESPRPIKVTVDSQGNRLTGDPVYYVNGMLTSRSTVLDEARFLAGRLRRPVWVILNPSFTDGRSTGTPTCADDVSEAIYDREWPINFATMNPAGILPALKTPNPPFAQLNTTTRQVTHLFYHSKGNVDIVSHSQGCIQVRNALLAAGSLGKEGNIRNRVAWVATGTPVNDNEVWPRPAKYRYLINATDAVPAIIGMRGGPKTADAVLFKNPRHEPTENYFPRIGNDLFFGSAGNTAPPSKPDGSSVIVPKPPRPPIGPIPPRPPIPQTPASVTIVNGTASPISFEYRTSTTPNYTGVVLPSRNSGTQSSRNFLLRNSQERLLVRYAAPGRSPSDVLLQAGSTHRFEPVTIPSHRLVQVGGSSPVPRPPIPKPPIPIPKPPKLPGPFFK